MVPVAVSCDPPSMRFARDAGELTLVLRSGTEIRLGDPGDLRLKLAIAGRILRLAKARQAAFSYLDVRARTGP